MVYDIVNLRRILCVVAAIFGMISAILWMISSFVKVPYKEERDSNGLIPSSLTKKGKNNREIDIIRTAENQVRWSKWAAFAASVAALSQSLALFILDG